MKKYVVLMTAAGLMLASSGAAWAHEDFCRFDRRGRRHYQSRLYARVIYMPVWPARQVPAGPAPVVCAAPSDRVVVNVSNSNGSTTPVTLRREGGTYVGPRGERYLHFPTEEQLKKVYGLK